MARYIEAEALKKVMCEDCDNKHLCAESPACETVQQIDAQPTADVDYERGFIEGYTKAESDIFHGGKYAPVKHGRWIPCSERLPENVGYGEEYPLVIFCTNKRSYVGFYEYYEDGRWLNYTADEEYIVEGVIAWMPLPEPYKMDEVTE